MWALFTYNRWELFVYFRLALFIIKFIFILLNSYGCAPNLPTNNLIHRFQCHCNAPYIGRTSQRLEVRIKELVPRDIGNHTISGHSKLLDSDIYQHLNDLNSCWVN